jgi:DNA-binding transcriptional LysR family regulator
VDQALEALKTVSTRPGEVTGRVRLSVPTVAVPLVLARLLPAFVGRHPRVEVEVQVDNRFVNIVAEGFDAGIRLHEAIERDMVEVRLTEPGRFVVAAAPSYLARRGTPEKPQDLLQHDCIGIRVSRDGARYAWELERGRKTWRVPVQGSVTTTPSSCRFSPLRAWACSTPSSRSSPTTFAGAGCASSSSPTRRPCPDSSCTCPLVPRLGSRRGFG